VGAITAPVIVSGITVAMGWQWAFIITGALGFIWIVFWLAHYHTPENHPKISNEELDYIHQDGGEGESVKSIRWLSLFKFRQTYAICSTRFISDWVWWFFLFWIPDFLSKTHGVNIKEVVWPLIVIYLVSSVGGIGGGWISSRFIEKGRSIDYSRKSAILICALIILPVMLVSQIANMWIAVGFIALAAAGHQGWASNIFTIVSDIYPKKAVGSMVGLSGFTGAIGGALSAAFVGLLLEATGSYFFIFLIASSVYLLNWIILKTFIHDIKPIEIEEF
jgi:ACS family hexuronate transporter-like MFS transporter